MRKTILFLIISLILISCGYMETKKQNLTRPVFSSQETLYLNRFPIDIIPTYFVWNAKYSEFLDNEDVKEGTLFKAIKNPSIEKNIYTLTDIKNKIDYKLIENIDLSNDYIYELSSGKKKIGVIKQLDKDDIYNYIYIAKDNSDDRSYRISGTSKGSKTTMVNPDIIHSFNFEIRDDNKIYCNIFKEYYIFKNEYEIIKNVGRDELSTAVLISISLFIDQILKENGYEYR